MIRAEEPCAAARKQPRFYISLRVSVRLFAGICGGATIVRVLVVLKRSRKSVGRTPVVRRCAHNIPVVCRILFHLAMSV